MTDSPNTTPAEPPQTLDTLVRTLAALKGRKSELTTKYDGMSRTLQEGIDAIETKIRAALSANGLRQARTDHGLVSLNTKRRYFAQDWEAYYAHIMATGNFGLLQKRVGETAIIAVIDETGAPPPGVSFTDAVEVKLTLPRS